MLEKHRSLMNYQGLAFKGRGEYQYLFGGKVIFKTTKKERERERNQFTFSIVMKVPETSLFMFILGLSNCTRIRLLQCQLHTLLPVRILSHYRCPKASSETY